MVAPILWPEAAQHRANVKKRVESCALARALAANEGEGGDAQTATKDECVQGIETVKDLMSDVFSVMDPQTGVRTSDGCLLNT